MFTFFSEVFSCKNQGVSVEEAWAEWLAISAEVRRAATARRYHDVGDIVGESAIIFIRRRIAGGDPTIHGVVRDAARRWARAMGRVHEVPVDRLPEPIHGEEHITWIDLADALATLPPAQRSAVEAMLRGEPPGKSAERRALRRGICRLRAAMAMAA